MEARIIGIIGIVVGLGLCGAATSHADVDVSGTWSGKGTCHGFDPTLPKNGKFTLSTTMTLLIQDNPKSLDMSASDPFAGAYTGKVLRSANVPSLPQAVILPCSTTVNPVSGHFFDAQFTIKSDAKGTDKSKMRATSIYTVLPGTVATCKWTFKRTSTASVAVAGCVLPTPTPAPTPAVTPTLNPGGPYQIICDCQTSPGAFIPVGACGADCSTAELIAQCTPACQGAGATYEFSFESCDLSANCTVGPTVTPTPAPTPVKYSVACTCSDGQVAKLCVDDCTSGTTTPACTAGCAGLGASYVEPPLSCQVNAACGGATR